MRPHHEQPVRISGSLRFAWWSIVAVYIVNMSGFVDTFTGSVTGCGQSWPLCHGTLKPWTWDVHAWIEFGHRTLVLLMIGMVVGVCVVAWRRFGGQKRVRLWVCLALSGIVLESFFGALSVFAINPPALMAAHLGIALLTFGGLIALAGSMREASEQRQGRGEKPAIPLAARRLSRFLFLYLYADIYVGAYVSASGAGPSFRGLLVPTESWGDAGVAWLIDWTHRSLAFGLMLLTLRLALLALRFRSQRPDFYRASLAAFLLVLIQAASGIALVLTHLSMDAILFHVANVTLLFGVLVWLGVQSFSSQQTRLAGAKKPNSRKRPSGSIPSVAGSKAIS